jgi:2-oxoglutarate dehydrogenase E2 component (dihydrolipoamide succinyltransferase)
MATGTVVDVVMPQMGVSVSEGTITRWTKQVGERIEADETIVEISTDKVDTEVPSPASGVVREILADEGDTVPVNTRIAVIDTAGDGSAAAPAAPSEPAASPEPEALAEETPDAAPAQQAAPTAPASAPAATNGEGGDESGRAFVSPVVARMLAEHSLNIDQITGSGRGGRVTKKDVQAFIESGGTAQAAPAAPQPEVHDVPHFAPPTPEPEPAPAPAAPAAPAAQPAAPAPQPGVAVQAGAGEEL